MSSKQKRGRPRKKHSEKLTEVLHVRVSDERKQILSHHARITNRSLGEVVNRALDAYFDSRNERFDKITVWEQKEES